MEPLNPQILDSLQGIVAEVGSYLQSMLQPSRFLQVLLLFALFFVAWGAARLIEPRFDAWIRAQEGMSKGRLRLLALLRSRMRGLIFIVLAWAAVAAIQGYTPFPSRRYLVVLWATIATAWVIIGVVSRLIRNPLMRRVVRWLAWIYVTLLYLGFLDAASRFLDALGISFGDFRITALGVLKAIIVTGALFTAARLITQGAARRIAQNRDIAPTFGVLAVKLLQIVLYGAAVFLGLKAVGFDLTGLAVLSGAVGVGLGFGLQKVVSNLVSGVIILLDKSVKPGDVISLGETFGWIESLGARYVSVVTRDGREYLIPNEDLITGQVVNWSHSNEFVRIDLEFGTSYHDDPHLVRRVAIEATRAAERVLKTRAAVCHITGFGDSSVNYVLRFWITDPREGLTNVRGQVFLALWDAFKSEGISIPFPQREVRLLAGTPGQGESKSSDEL
jgi:small-conductance mechanosensitive channel